MNKKLRFLGLFLGLIILSPILLAQQFDIPGPAGSNTFGASVTVLTNGNYVVSDPLYDEAGVQDVGAAYLYNGATHELISKLTGSRTNDYVGSGGATALTNGNFVVVSPNWYRFQQGDEHPYGAATWGNGLTGLSGIVSSTNSLTGNYDGFNFASGGVRALPNGNYIVVSAEWSTGANGGSNGRHAERQGLVTWGNGATGTTGIANILNSLGGAYPNDFLGSNTIILSNGNYLVKSYYKLGSSYMVGYGSVTWCDGTKPTSGVPSEANSLIGAKLGDDLGYEVVVLSNGNYVARTGLGVYDAPSITWGNGATGVVGKVSKNNSLMNIGNAQIFALTNGNYVVTGDGYTWDEGILKSKPVGAMWVNGTTGGPTGNYDENIHSSNSLKCMFSEDMKDVKVTPLSDGNYVVDYPNWDNGSNTDVGAVTWCNGTTGTGGFVSSTNSIIGASSGDKIGMYNLIGLQNGNYVIASPLWDNGTIKDVGAITWVNGTGSHTGTVTSENSMIGSNAFDQVGRYNITPLTNGNYVINSPNWDNGSIVDAGAVTWLNGTTPTSGTVNISNSLVGSSTNDPIGLSSIYGNRNGIKALPNGDYIVVSSFWDNQGIVDAGAITWGDGEKGITGLVSSENSLVGSTQGDMIGSESSESGIVTLYPNGNCIIKSPEWNNGLLTDAGAVTFSDGISPIVGSITSCNSVLSETTRPYPADKILSASYNNTYDYMIVGLKQENKIVIYRPGNVSLAHSSDKAMTNLGTDAAELIAEDGCRILATLTPDGNSPIQGVVKSKVWIESAIPTAADQPFVARHYEITPTNNPTTASTKVTLYFTKQEFLDFNAHSGSLLDLPTDNADAIGKSHLRIGKFSGTSTDGSGLPASYAANSASVINPAEDDIVWNQDLARWEVSFDVNGFSGFIVQTADVPLPVRLISFTGKTQEQNAVLYWKIADAENFSHFEVERSSDAKKFQLVSKVDFVAKKDSYDLIDQKITGQVYYRLKMVDLDGTYAYSRTISLDLKGSLDIYAYPNPFSKDISVTIPNHDNEKVKVQLVNSKGATVLTKEIRIDNNKLNISGLGLPIGTYVMSVETATETVNMKVVKE